MSVKSNTSPCMYTYCITFWPGNGVVKAGWRACLSPERSDHNLTWYVPRKEWHLNTFLPYPSCFIVFQGFLIWLNSRGSRCSHKYVMFRLCWSYTSMPVGVFFLEVFLLNSLSRWLKEKFSDVWKIFEVRKSLI